MREVKVKIRRACSTCDGSGRVYMKQADRNGLLVDGVSDWYECPTCRNKAEGKLYEEWITLSDLKTLLEPGVRKDGVPNAGD